MHPMKSLIPVILLPVMFAFGMAAPADSGGGMDTIVLKDGGEVRGTIVKRNARTVWIDLGPTLVSFDLEQVADIHSFGIRGRQVHLG